MSASEQRVFSAIPQWLRCLTIEGYRPDDRESRVQVLIHIQLLANEGRWEEMDEALRMARASDFSEVGLIHLVRGTFRFRDRMTEWLPFKDRVAAELYDRRAPTEKLLSGL